MFTSSSSDNDQWATASGDPPGGKYYCPTYCENELVILDIKEKIRCYFLFLVLFLLACKGILPNSKRDIKRDEVPFGFG